MNLAPPTFDPPIGHRLEALALISVLIEVNSTFSGDVNTAKFAVGWSLVVLRDELQIKNRQIQIRLELRPDGVPDSMPYMGHLQAMAQIGFQRDGEDPSLLDQAAAWHAASPLVGFVRTQLHTITGSGPFTKLLVGPVAIADLISSAVLQQGDKVTPLYPAQDQSAVAIKPA